MRIKVGAAPKHIFGYFKNLEGLTDINDVAEKAGFDFTAEKRIQYWRKNQDPNGEEIPNPEKVAIVNADDDDRYLGTCGINYGIVQYRDALAFTQHIVNQGEANYIHGGVSHGGSRAFLVMKSAEYIEISPGDRIECYFYLSTAHDSKGSMSLIPSPLRPLNNIILLPSGRMEAMKFKHSKHVNTHIAVAAKTIKKVKEYFEEFRESFDRLAQTELTDAMLETYLKVLYPGGKESTKTAENTRNKIKDILMTEKSLQIPSCKNTLLGAYFAVCQYNDHYTTTKKTGRDELSARIESRMAVNGTVAKKKAEGLAFAYKLSEI